ncbi:hypothetical protein MRX96_014022 [Rhipicephalus microplus]|uniref:uncharacterized protein LOC119180691 isoform X2 n=1 Tax=Rhipicephalus microplus TaxID=6941 RepID=UPI001888462E|nr:protein phosphatase inhibitor 2-like isoform X2 [Rhipicephalus microplus]
MRSRVVVRRIDEKEAAAQHVNLAATEPALGCRWTREKCLKGMSHYSPSGRTPRGYSPQEYLDQAYRQPGYHYSPQQSANDSRHNHPANAGPSRLKRPILKPSGSFERRPSTQDLKWDEQNIKETFHPKNKDYGFMIVDEPKTPYHYDATTDPGGVNPQQLAQKIESATSMQPSALTPAVVLTEEQKKAEEAAREKHRLFEERRKKHYHMERFAPAENSGEEDEEEGEDSED